MSAILTSICTASDNREIESLVAQGKPAEALVALKQMIPKPTTSSDYYNYALLFGLNHLPLDALAYADRALVLNPWDDVIQDYLDSVSKRHALDLSSSLNERVTEYRYYLPSIVGLWLILIGLFGISIKNRLKGRITVCAIGACFLSFASFLPHLNRPRFIINESTTVYTGPGSSFIKTGDLIAGSSVRYLGKSNESWVLVRFTPEKKGWIHASSLLLFSDK